MPLCRLFIQDPCHTSHTFLPPHPPAHHKSHLIGLVWSSASISIHFLWPWLNLMGVKEVFILAVCTLIVCLVDLVNWKRWKLSQSVWLIGSSPPHHQPPPCLLYNTLPLCFLSKFTLGYCVTFCLGQRDFSACVWVYVCTYMCICFFFVVFLSTVYAHG